MFYALFKLTQKALIMDDFLLSRRHFFSLGAAPLLFTTGACAQSSSNAGPSAGPMWRDGPALPFAAQEIYPTLHAGQIHLAGGFISDGETISGATDRHIVFDPETGLWADATPLPRPLHHPNLVSFADTLFAIGGFAVSSPEAVWVMQSRTWILEDGTWRAGPELPQPNGESVTATLGAHLHVCSGRKPSGASNASWNDHSDIGDHFVLTGIADAWTPAAPLPTARNSAAGAMIGSNWHVVGGRTVTGGNTPAHEVYDAQEDRWRAAAPMPQGQGGLAAAAVEGKLYAFGGEFFNNGGGVYPEAWMYDPEQDAWSALPDMPHPRHGLGAAALNGEIYVMGGALQVGGSKTSNLVEIFTP